VTTVGATFEEYVAARGHALTRTAYLLTGDHGHAEDLVQVALGKAYASWGRVSRMESPDAYVRKIMVNQHISRWRRVRGRESLTDRPPDTVVVDPTAAFAAADAVRSVVRALPPRQRAAVVLRFYEDLPDAQIAALLGCSEATVRSQISRALAAIRAGGRLSDDGAHDALAHDVLEGGDPA
jgi:RNA polymerase sigma-70 factor (sigma-E family)